MGGRLECRESDLGSLERKDMVEMKQFDLAVPFQYKAYEADEKSLLCYCLVDKWMVPIRAPGSWVSCTCSY